MAQKSVDIHPQQIPVIDTYEGLTAAARELAVRPSAYILQLLISDELSEVPLGHRRQVNMVTYALNLANPRWTTLGRPRELVVPDDVSGVSSEPFDESIQPNSDLVVGRYVLSGLVRATFFTPTDAYLQDRGSANRRLSELLADGRTDPTLVDPDNVLQGEVAEGQMLLYRPNEGGQGRLLAYNLEVPGIGYVEQTVLFARSEVPA